MIHNSKRNGFTLVEIAVAIAIMAVISGVTFLGLFSHRAIQNLKLTMSELVTVIRDTQKRSITQEEGSQWGARLISFPNGDSRYEVFRGANYAPGTVYSLGRGIKFGEPFVSSTYDIIFAPISGNFSKNKIISLHGNKNDFLVGDIILNKLGLVTSRIEKDLFGYWHFDEGKGNAIHDASGLDNNGILYNGWFPCNPCTNNWLTGNSCKTGNCLIFQSELSYITGTLTDPITLKEFTIETWVNLSSNQQKGAIWTGYDDGFTDKISGRFLASSRKPSFLTKADGEENWNELSAKSSLKNIGVWYHLAYVYDGQYKKIYINGVKDKEDILLDKSFTINFFDIGRSESEYLLEGNLDEVRVYKRALSGEEILAHYNDFK